MIYRSTRPLIDVSRASSLLETLYEKQTPNREFPIDDTFNLEDNSLPNGHSNDIETPNGHSEPNGTLETPQNDNDNSEDVQKETTDISDSIETAAEQLTEPPESSEPTESDINGHQEDPTTINETEEATLENEINEQLNNTDEQTIVQEENNLEEQQEKIQEISEEPTVQI